MNLVSRLRQIVDALPEGSSVTLRRDVLLSWIKQATGDETPADIHDGPPIADLTVEDIAEAYGKAPSTVRGWLQGVPGVYRIGQELRISREDWRAYLDSLSGSKSNGSEASRTDLPSGELSDWRSEL